MDEFIEVFVFVQVFFTLGFIIDDEALVFLMAQCKTRMIAMGIRLMGLR